MADNALEPKRRNIKLRPVRVEGEVAYVPLTKGLEAIIDAADVPLVDSWNWHAQTLRTGHAYANRSVATDRGSRAIAMHRVIMNADGREVDHINGDGLDNRRANLRLCSHGENMRNRVLDRRNTLGLRGVWSSNGKFRACIQFNGRTIHLGTFTSKKEASAAYVGAAKALFAEFSPV